MMQREGMQSTYVTFSSAGDITTSAAAAHSMAQPVMATQALMPSLFAFQSLPPGSAVQPHSYVLPTSSQLLNDSSVFTLAGGSVTLPSAVNNSLHSSVTPVVQPGTTRPPATVPGTLVQPSTTAYAHSHRSGAGVFGTSPVMFSPSAQPYYTPQHMQFAPQNTVLVPVAVQTPGIGSVRYNSPVSSSGPLASVRPSNPSSVALPSMPLQTLCSTSVTTSPRITANQRQPVIGQAAPVFVGQFGTGVPAAALGGPGVLPFALRAPGMAAVPLAGHSMSNSALMTADGHVISPQALQLAMMHLQQQQQQQQLLATQNGALFGSQTMFTQSPATTSSAVPSENVSPRLHAPLVQPVVTSTRPASASTVVMAAASTQTPDDSIDVCQVQNVSKMNESGSQTVALDGVMSSEPSQNRAVSDASTGCSHLAVHSSGVADLPSNTVQRSSAIKIPACTSTTAPSFIDRQTARVRPRILTHVIEGFVIQEANEPFPVHHSFANSLIESSDEASCSSASNQSDDDSDSSAAAEGKKHTSPRSNQAKCRLCGQRITDKFRLHRGRKFCSQACLRKYDNNSMEQTVPYSAESQTPRTTVADEFRSSTELPQNDLRTTSAVQEAYPTLPDVSRPHVASRHVAQYSSVDNVAMETSLSRARESSTPSFMPLPAAVASPPRRPEHMERRPSNVITPPYSIEQWTVTDVFEFVHSLPGCTMYADQFRRQEIDGPALTLLTEDHLMTTLGVKLGPALKICSSIRDLRERTFD